MRRRDDDWAVLSLPFISPPCNNYIHLGRGGGLKARWSHKRDRWRVRRVRPDNGEKQAMERLDAAGPQQEEQQQQQQKWAIVSFLSLLLLNLYQIKRI